MAKTFPYAVKYNGKYYAPNAPIEEKKSAANSVKKGDNDKIEAKNDEIKTAAKSKAKS